VPSVAKIIQIGAAVTPSIARTITLNVVTLEGESATEKTDQAIMAADKGTLVEVGLTSTCPYGLSACWGGAYEGLKQMSGVQFVRPIANAEDSTAYVYLTNDGLPDIDQWPNEFASTANAGYTFRGVEVTVRGMVEKHERRLYLQGNVARPTISLAPLEGTEKVQWDRFSASARPADPDELLAYQRLAASLENAGAVPNQFEVTGPLKNHEEGFILYIRKFQR
jgi:galactose oxidase